MLRIVIFGVGKALTNQINFLIDNNDKFEIVAFCDNNEKLINKKWFGIPIYKPNMISDIEYDKIVILSNKFYSEMQQELVSYGIQSTCIWNRNRLKAYVTYGEREEHGRKINFDSEQEKVLIISTDMDFSGGTLVAIYAAKALKNRGKQIMLATPVINPNLLREIIEMDLSVTIYPALPYLYEEDREWIQKYDAVIVNVFQMMNCAYEISKFRPVLWWIHEGRSKWISFYEDTQREFEGIDCKDWMNRVNIVGVSNVAKEAFNYYYPSMMEETLPFGIPDCFSEEVKYTKRRNKVVFAVTAGFAEFKGQDVLLEALEKLKEDERNSVEVWFIGPSGRNMQDLIGICKNTKGLRFLGLLTHEEVIENLPEIDVLVCPSRIETMSMSTIEGMMFEKIVIASDKCGIAEFIDNRKNGFVFKVGNATDLAKKISWIINNKEKWSKIQKSARETYEREFTLKVFGERLENQIEIAKKYSLRRNKNEDFIDVFAPIS